VSESEYTKGSGPHDPGAPRPWFSRPFVPHIQLKEPWSFTEAPDGPPGLPFECS